MLYLASDNGDLHEVKRLLQEGVNPNVYRHAKWHDYTALHAAVYKGYLEISQALIEHGGDCEAKTQQGKTALFLASEAGLPTMLRYLLDIGCDVEACNEFNSSPLLMACQQGHQEVVDILLKGGAKVNTQGKGGNTPLHHASYKRNPLLACTLIKAGADVTRVDDNRNTPLHIAAKMGLLSSVRVLMKAEGAQQCLTMKGQDGLTPGEHAHRKGHRQIVECLESADMNGKNKACCLYSMYILSKCNGNHILLIANFLMCGCLERCTFAETKPCGR